VFEAAGELAQRDQARIKAQERGIVLLLVHGRQDPVADVPRRLARGAECHAAAAVHEERDAGRRVRVRLDADDFAGLAVLGYHEVLGIEGPDDLALFVTHDCGDRHEVHAGLERRHWLLGGRGPAAEQYEYRERVCNPTKEHAVSLSPADIQGRLNLFSSGRARTFKAERCVGFNLGLNLL